MIELLAKWWIPDRENVRNPQVREKYGTLCSLVGIGLNLLLSAGKFLAGLLSGSIAITADAVNNLSDAGSSVVTLLGFKLAGKKPDPEHPFGHGRIEYIAGLCVALVILLMGVELIGSSIDKILHPQAVEWSLLTPVILGASILIKLYMFRYNRRIGEKIQSGAMKATGMDSLSDAIATGAVLLSSVVGKLTGLQIDGYCGVAVACFILYSGYQAAKGMLDPLLGQAPQEPEFVAAVRDLVLSNESVIGIHDMVIHDYGPGRVMITLHAEVPASGNLLEMHDLIDNIEKELGETFRCSATIHMDPVVVDDETTNHLRTRVTELLCEVDGALTMHDFRTVQGPTHTNLIFDVVVPYSLKLEDDALKTRLTERVQQELGAQYQLVVQIDRNYVQ